MADRIVNPLRELAELTFDFPRKKSLSRFILNACSEITLLANVQEISANNFMSFELVINTNWNLKYKGSKNNFIFQGV